MTQLVLSMVPTCEVPYNADANASRVICRRMSTHGVPATPLVHVAIFTNHKVVPDITPTVGIYVVVLVRTDYSSALGLGCAVSVATPVVNHSVRYRHSQCCEGTRGGSCTPLASADYPRTCYYIKSLCCLSVYSLRTLH